MDDQFALPRARFYHMPRNIFTAQHISYAADFARLWMSLL